MSSQVLIDSLGLDYFGDSFSVFYDSAEETEAYVSITSSFPELYTGISDHCIFNVKKLSRVISLRVFITLKSSVRSPRSLSIGRVG